MTPAELIIVLETNREQLIRANIAVIYLLGSHARREAGRDSDIDLLIEPAEGLVVGGLQMASWRRLLQEIVGPKADAVVAEFLRRRVLAEAKRDRIEVFRTHFDG